MTDAPLAPESESAVQPDVAQSGVAESGVTPPDVAQSDVAQPDAEEPTTGPVEPAVSFRVMNVDSVLFDLIDPSPLVHLMEVEEPYRYLAIPIALPEAVALNNAIAGVAGRRPGTHELFSELLARTQCDVIAVRIVRGEAGVYYAELDVMTPRSREVFDCRPSDGLILALRQGVPAPVLCAEDVLASRYTDSN